ncbi:MAG: efflux RND transporter periplasmic adaptor subunit, partial [Acidobacteria bacterium]|nr:efflux RND transporter periplasmic adaptor subunit [Acidobacteriota bacterium]
MKLVVFVLVLLFAAACGSAPKPAAAAHSDPPATVQNKVAESDLTRIILTEKAEQRLGIALAPVVSAATGGRTEILGDIVAIPGRSILVNAPASGVISKFRMTLTPGMEIRTGQDLFHMTPQVAAQRDLKLTLQADVESTKARLDNATQQANRARQLLRDMAGSQRNVDSTEQELGQAKAAYEAALARLKRIESAPLDADVEMTVSSPSSGILRQLQVAPGQIVNAGSLLFEIADFSKVWLRVPVFVGQLKDMQRASIIDIRDVDGEGRNFRGRLVDAPPTADPLAATSDTYYEIDNPGHLLRPGQRMSASLPTKDMIPNALSVPVSAILYDVHGDSWVYIAEGNRKYRRQRVAILRGAGSSTLIARGLSESMKVVS